VAGGCGRQLFCQAGFHQTLESRGEVERLPTERRLHRVAEFAQGEACVASAEQARTGACVAAVFTALNRAEWALARVAGGEGALAGKYRHPTVAPHLRALQRQFPQIEALLARS